jgi:alpha,alpha-trehalase
MTGWSLIYDGFNPDEEGLREALCTLGNGYFATRGAAVEVQPDDIHYPGTYLAGGYNRLSTEIAGRVVENEDLVNLPNWLCLNFRIGDGKWFTLEEVEILSYRQELDMQRGILKRAVQFEDKRHRRTRLKERRLVHMAQPHLAAIEINLTVQNWSGRLEIRSALDGRVRNTGVKRYRDLNKQHLEPVESDDFGEDGIYIKVQTIQSELLVAQAARTRIFKDSLPIAAKRELILKTAYIAHQFTVDISEGDEITVEKVVALYSSRDHTISECGLEARQAISRAGQFNDLLETHVLAWDHLWRRFDMHFQGRNGQKETQTEMILHLYTFHLLQTSSMHTIDLDVGVPSRGWHGEAYRGHIFWDELFIFPFLNLRYPEITRSLLMYRYRRLKAAREAAQETGYRGAMYPWQSGSNGREESQQVHLNPQSGRWMPDNSHLQRHVNAAIAYNICKYYQTSGDMEFLSAYGAEMLLEIARFWSSMATYNDEFDRYEILGVMGPDEYHDSYPEADNPGLANNAYTNIMAVWVLSEALEVLDLLPEDRSRELSETLDLSTEELELWEDISHKMRIIFHDNGIISQFEGYDRLEELDWKKYREKYDNIQRLDRILEAEGDSPNRYKVSKQADVLMLFYLFSSEELQRLFKHLGYPFEYETIPKNIEYYLKRTSHGSTLSWVVHSWVMTRADRVRSWKLFNEALKSDVADIQGGTTPEGIHLGAMAGTVNILQEGYTGIDTRGDVLWFSPCLPEELTGLSMHIRYRGHSLKLEIFSDQFTVTALRTAQKPIKIGFNGEVYELKTGTSRKFVL